MAFLCPASFAGRRRRRRAEIDIQSDVEKGKDFSEVVTEFEPTKMVVVRDFTPCVDDELKVKRGDFVKALYQENEWRFVVAEDGREGFIPYTYCIPVAQQVRKAISKDQNRNDVNLSNPGTVQHVPLEDISIGEAMNMINSSETAGNSNEFTQEFVKRHHGRYIVLFDYDALQEDDISAGHGERVTVLNKDDEDWYWVKTDHGGEGFIPRRYLQRVQPTVGPDTSAGPKRNHLSTIKDTQQSLPNFLANGRDVKFEVKQLIVTGDFTAHSKHELTIEKGEQLFTDDSDLDKQSWIWVYSPRSRKRGFVPRSRIRWSQNTTFL